MVVQTQGIPLRLEIDGIVHNVTLDPEPLFAYVQNNLPPIIDPAAKHSFSEAQMRTAIKGILRFVITNYVHPVIEETDYPKLQVDRSDDYITGAGFYLLHLMVNVLAATGGIEVEVDGDEVREVRWRETEAPR